MLLKTNKSNFQEACFISAMARNMHTEKRQAPINRTFLRQSGAIVKSGMSPSIVLNCIVNLFILQNYLKNVKKRSFEVCNTRTKLLILAKYWLWLPDNWYHWCTIVTMKIAGSKFYHIWTEHFNVQYINTFTAIVDLSRFNNSCLKSPASTLVNLTFQSRALRSFSLNQIRNLSL